MRRVTKVGSSRNPSAPAEARTRGDRRITTGQRVVHKAFGGGEVLDSSCGTKKDPRMLVMFDEAVYDLGRRVRVKPEDLRHETEDGK